MLLEPAELAEHAKNPKTLVVLTKLMWFYENQSRKELVKAEGGDVKTWDNRPEFRELMEATREWLAPTQGESNGRKNRKKRLAHVDSSTDEPEVDVQPTTRRRLNRKRRKDNK